MDRNLGARIIALIGAGLIVLAGCNSSPTVPVPPPEMWEVWPPNQEGYSTIIGEPNAAEEGDVALVINEDSDETATDTVEKDGSFEVEIKAEIGHVIILRILRDDLLSKKSEKEVRQE